MPAPIEGAPPSIPLSGLLLPMNPSAEPSPSSPQPYPPPEFNPTPDGDGEQGGGGDPVPAPIEGAPPSIPNPSPYRGASLIRNSAPIGPYSRTMPRVLLWS